MRIDYPKRAYARLNQNDKTMKNYNIVSFTNNENKTIYFSHIVDLGEFGKSLAMTYNKDEAMKFSTESEALKYARAYSKRAIVERLTDES